MAGKVVNVVVAGLGGQGAIKASDILADAACRAGFDVKKAEIHGMSQRGGSVTSDVRFGPEVLSPMIPAGEATVGREPLGEDEQVPRRLHCVAAQGMTRYRGDAHIHIAPQHAGRQPHEPEELDRRMRHLRGLASADGSGRASWASWAACASRAAS